MSERRFPIQGDTVINPNGSRRSVLKTSVPWSEAEIAYETYSQLFGTSQSLERLAERGGFGRWEFAILRAGFDTRNRMVLEHPPVTEDPKGGQRMSERSRPAASLVCNGDTDKTPVVVESEGAREASEVIRLFLIDPCIRGERCRHSNCASRGRSEYEWCWSCQMVDSPFWATLLAALTSSTKPSVDEVMRTLEAMATPAVTEELEDTQEQLVAALEQCVEALRLTQEYVGEETLPPLPGWTWYDATVNAQDLLEKL